jgi:hypothetical protein
LLTKTRNSKLEKKHSLKIQLPWKHQVPSTSTCHNQLSPDKFQIFKVAKYGSFSFSLDIEKSYERLKPGRALSAPLV